MGLAGEILNAANRSTPPFRWVPIRSLSARHRPRILAHLLALPEADRYLRFGYAASDAQLAHYTDLIDFSQDEVFGIFNRRLELLAMAHLAILPAPGDDLPREAEFGVSVLSKARGRGYGSRLFDHAVLHARNRHINTLVIHALSENTAMLRIVRSAGATVERDGGESQARLRLPRDDLMSHVDQLVEGQAAELDYRFKVQARRVDGLLEAIDEVKSRFAHTRE
ncbi:MAG TPA: GNAT family N-acetyltransferase, partial [Acidiferrobacterales bacterium]|nr:GNAT family N-acetyltransferase [Acidiferrobacterales bacterium]